MLQVVTGLTKMNGMTGGDDEDDGERVERAESGVNVDVGVLSKPKDAMRVDTGYNNNADRESTE